MKNVTVSKAADLVRSGAVGVIPTDTLYGIVASAFDTDAVERVYRIRGRDSGKPCIVLLADMADLTRFGIDPDEVSRKRLSEVWPGPVSVVLPCSGAEWEYLHRGTGTIAFRVPDDLELRVFLASAGPVIAPSANPAGERPAETADEARLYFSDMTDFLVDGGRCSGEPSTVARLGDDGRWNVLRPGPGVPEQLPAE
ncbi:MAG: threonylcarbamoyl-AMP synthase [Candidatus Moranbacteria bacterium]|nr:threonylcarbamoyl-AMP synthase [Candidatus Moranbacteria bacterium]